MTSQSEKQHARIQATGTLLKNTGAAAAQPRKEFKFGGENCTIELLTPKVSEDGAKFQINASTIWDIDFGDSEKDLVKWLKNLKEPLPIRGFYIPATFLFSFGDSYDCEFALERNLNKKKNTTEPEFLINDIKLNGQMEYENLSLPLARLKVFALQLAGVFGTAYPPNFKKFFAGGESYIQTDKDGGIDIDRYGYQITRSSALIYTQGENPHGRLLNDEVLREVARLHRTLPHGSKIQDIAHALNISERSARFYVAQCRHPKHGLLPATGRTRSKKTKKRTKGKK